MRLVGENVPVEENWHRKERLKKTHKLHSERQPTPVNIIQYAPDVFVVVLKISYAYVSPGTHKNTDPDAGGLGMSLRFCSSNNISGDADIRGLHTTL